MTYASGRTSDFVVGAAAQNIFSDMDNITVTTQKIIFKFILNCNRLGSLLVTKASLVMNEIFDAVSVFIPVTGS